MSVVFTEHIIDFSETSKQFNFSEFEQSDLDYLLSTVVGYLVSKNYAFEFRNKAITVRHIARYKELLKNMPKMIGGFNPVLSKGFIDRTRSKKNIILKCPNSDCKAKAAISSIGDDPPISIIMSGLSRDSFGNISLKQYLEDPELYVVKKLYCCSCQQWVIPLLEVKKCT